MTLKDCSPKALFLANQSVVEEIISYLGQKYAVSSDTKEDFTSEVFIKLMDQDYAVFKKFKGHSQIKTYLTVVISRFFLDYRDRIWGRWRPSTQAKALGELGILVEQYISRDGYSVDACFQMLKHNHLLEVNEQDIYDIFHQLPHRHKRQEVGEATLVRKATPDADPQTAFQQKLADKDLAVATAAVRQCLEQMPEQDQLILRLHFEKGVPLSRVALVANIQPKAIYRKTQALLSDLRHRLEARGIQRIDVESLLR